MAGLKISNFLGIAPKISPELLSDTAAQTAHNCKLYSGDLIPYPQPVLAANSGRTGTTRSLYILRNPISNAPVWLSWPDYVDVAVASLTVDEEQRFYYTGDGAPKASDYRRATTGLPPYPSVSFDLGLPLPDTVPITTALPAPTVSTVSFSRDSGNTVTITTSGAHNFRTGNTVTVAGFTNLSGTYSQSGTLITVTVNNHGLSNGAQVFLNFTSGAAVDGTFTVTNAATNTFDVTAAAAATTSGAVELDLRSFNASSVEITKTGSTTFTYFSPGPPVALTSYTSGTVTLGGLTQARSYVYTWMSGWEEESIASKPSDNLYIKEGQTVTVSGLPSFPPTGNNFIRGIRLYRTLASTSGTDYFRLATLWFPVGTGILSRSANVVTVVNASTPHMLSEGDRFKLTGVTSASFNVVDGIVTAVLDSFSFQYAQVGANEVSSGGILYHDISETTPTGTARYWGDGSYDFTDDFDSLALTTILDTDEYDPPPTDLQGLVAIQNSILAGFISNEIYFSEPAQPHAWPARYKQTLEHKIVRLVPYGGSLLALTESYPYLIDGADPANMAVRRIDAQYPCVSRQGVVTMDYGVVYPTYDGLVVISQSGGVQLATKVLFETDTWQGALDPRSIVAAYYGEGYLASHSTGGFVFERDERTGGYFTTVDYSATAAIYDTIAGKFYYASGANGDIYQWDNVTQPPMVQEWKSKTIVTKEAMNLGAARVIADYGPPAPTWESLTDTWPTTTILWNLVNNVTFRLWADKTLILTTTIDDQKVFRLPTGFRTDTYEVSVQGNIRVRAIHLGLTPLGLKEV